MENSELDLHGLWLEAAKDEKAIAETVKSMESELKKTPYPDLMPALARLEIALKRFMAENLGASKFAVFANKCWPAFQPFFEMVPCYVNGRLAAQGYPVACETDIYGALSEYMVMAATGLPATLLDINNSCPADVIPKGADLAGAKNAADLFMGFHCGNTCSACMDTYELRYQTIMKRLQEPNVPAKRTRGTLEGRLKSGPTTLFRLQGKPRGGLKSYIAEGGILPLDPCTFGGTGVFSIPEFPRFYRHVLVAGGYPHHGAAGFAHAGGILFEALKILGVTEIAYPLPSSLPYPDENPFA
jgi:L-fucose isomerase-like protein